MCPSLSSAFLQYNEGGEVEDDAYQTDPKGGFST